MPCPFIKKPHGAVRPTVWYSTPHTHPYSQFIHALCCWVGGVDKTICVKWIHAQGGSSASVLKNPLPQQLCLSQHSCHVSVFSMLCSILLHWEERTYYTLYCSPNPGHSKSLQPDSATLVDYVTMNQLFCNVTAQWGNIHTSQTDHSSLRATWETSKYKNLE